MIIGNEILDLQLTLIDSAQCFRWTKRGEKYGCVIGGNCVWLSQTPAGLEAEGEIDLPAIRHYLDLDRDYSKVALEYSHIPVARQAIEMFPGMRVMNQPTWEALITFILSANNNVKRIRTLADALCMHFPQPENIAAQGLLAFPTPEMLAGCSEEELRSLKMGYRAPFLIETARRVCEGFDLAGLASMPYAEAHRALVTLPGVGDKVADCVLLFGCGHTSAFPVDVWVDRLLKSWFGVEAKGRAQMLKTARNLLGDHAGLLQQFLFHAARTGAISLD